MLGAAAVMSRFGSCATSSAQPRPTVRMSGAFARTNERRQLERQERELGIAEWLAQLKRAATCLVARAEGASQARGEDPPRRYVPPFDVEAWTATPAVTPIR